MAILTYGNKEKRYGIAEQTTWGTAEIDSATFLELACEATTINRDVKHRMSNQSHGTRFDIATEAVNDTKRCAPTISLKGIAKQDEVDHFINAFFQSATEDAIADVFGKTFVMATGQPDFSADAGHFLTVIERHPQASKSIQMHDCIASSLKLSAAPGEMMMYEVELVGRGTVTETSNPSGTWTIEGNDYWYTEDMDRFRYYVAAWDDLHLSPDAGWEISMTQDVVLIGADGTGNSETVGLVNRKGEFTINALDDGSAASTLIGAHRLGTQLDFNIAWGGATAGETDADFDITFSGKLTDAVRDNADILGITATGIMLGDTAALTPITLIMANAEDRTW